jgi:hypothetical protein
MAMVSDAVVRGIRPPPLLIVGSLTVIAGFLVVTLQTAEAMVPAAPTPTAASTPADEAAAARVADVATVTAARAPAEAGGASEGADGGRADGARGGASGPRRWTGASADDVDEGEGTRLLTRDGPVARSSAL